MDIKEYNEVLDKLDSILENEGISEDLLNKIEYMYDFKPISTKWHILNFKALLKQEKYDKAISRYKDMINKEYEFEDNTKIWTLLSDAYRLSGHDSESKKNTYMRNKLINNTQFEKVEEELREIRQKFMGGDESRETIFTLEKMYYETCNSLMAYCMYLYAEYLYPETKDANKESLYLNVDNMAYYSEYIKDKKDIVVVMDKDNSQDYDILVYVLHALGVSVYMICDVIQEEGKYDIKDTLNISLENVAECDDCKLITAIEKTTDGISQGDNIPYIIDYICKELMEDDFVLVLATGDVIEKCISNPDVSKRFERLHQYEAPYLERKVGFGWCGDYYTYISRIYNADVREWVNRETEYDFSIVIPVRNVSETLYYTLKTCLEQDYDGKFEVVISDNSTNGNTNAYEICQRFDNENLNYYKTPRDLNLTKSYEYAYLQTKGAFVIPIGSDDGVLPWALSTLKGLLDSEIMKRHYIINWVRGFYAWPGFNGGQENQLTIPMYCEKNKIQIREVNTEDLIKRVIDSPQTMYMLPNLYINSGFKREYMKIMYEKTGSILNGSAQDIYTGLLNCAINDKILYMDYLITIAGMSSSSVGVISNNTVKNYSEENKKRFADLVGANGIYKYVQGKLNNKIPYYITIDITGMYRSLDKLEKKNFLEELMLEKKENIKKIYLNCYNAVNNIGENYTFNLDIGDRMLLEIDKEILDWYQQEVMNKKDNLLYVTNEIYNDNDKKKKYKEGYSVGGGITLDASRYSVTNVYQASKLFKSFLGI